MDDRSSIRVLILDDEPFMLDLFGQMLGNLGFVSCTKCESGQKALEEMDRPGEPPNLILLDLSMPRMDGIEFIRHIVTRRYAGGLILVSGEETRLLQTVVKMARAEHIDVLGHLRKPFTPTALKAILLNWTPSARVQPPTESKTYSGQEIGQAIEENQLVNYYQPKVDVASGAVVGVEALARWRHPSDGLVLPTHFIGVAESTGLIEPLTHLMFCDALGQARAWQDENLSLKISFNVSVANLSSIDFADFAARQAAAAGIPTRSLILEVTEGRLMEDVRAPIEVLTRLHLMRFRLSIDDFGSEYSSFNRLRDIPFDELKIDRSFVHSAWSDETVRAIFYASLGIAETLQMDSVAEGVEDKDDWDFLRTTRCGLAQGYFIARPMPPEDVPDWIEQWQARKEWNS